jgi:hypothetical protein
VQLPSEAELSAKLVDYFILALILAGAVAVAAGLAQAFMG